ncbi:UDP-N-acetylmuramate dehydrogenase [Telmatobacter bradus]|uniref:UDP-N-acetylmuramate dehydrogenase n=1 Tax=Telmatobacter bradus TaxID=474953 RepID=UPI003B439CA2
MNIEENILLATLTTFGIGGPARWLVAIRTEEELVEAVSWARARQLPLFVLGGGSNLLVSDAGFDGLVMRMALEGVEEQGSLLRAAAGMEWDAFVSLAVSRGSAGVECLAGIPGTVGGTPVQNVGAYGQEVGTAIESVRAYDLETNTFIEFSAAECGFSYRRSRFNTVDRGRYIVTRVDYRLTPQGTPQLDYADLKKHFADRASQPSLVEVAEAVRAIRRTKAMSLIEGDTDCQSAGSFFKNPTVEASVAEQVRSFAKSHGLALRTYPTADGREKIPAAWLIEQAGFPKGFTMGRAAINSRHTLALVNRGGATATEVLRLAASIQAGVLERFHIPLEMEPVRVGFPGEPLP